MGKEMTEKRIEKYMEYLMELLHQEWERTGKTKKEVMVSLLDVPVISMQMAGTIMEKLDMLEDEEMSFKESMALSKENYVLLRLVKKIKKAEEKATKKGVDSYVCVELDKEEYKLYRSIMRQQEGKIGEEVSGDLC